MDGSQRRRRGAGPAPPRSCRRRRGGPGTPPGLPARRARPCSTARSGRPIRRRPGATPGPRPHRRAGWGRTGRAPPRRRPGRGAPRWARRGWARPGAPGPPGSPVERRAHRPVTGPPARGGPASGTIRGATAATSGSSKWPRSGASHPSVGTQSESTNATSALSTAANPALRAPAGPTLVASPTKRAPWRSAVSLVAPASADASSTTMQAKPAQRAEQPVELERPVAHRHHDGDVPGSEAAAVGARGERAGRDQAACQQLGAPARPHRGARPPALHESAGPLGNPEEAERAAPEQHRPAVEVPCRRVLAPGRRSRAAASRTGTARDAAARASRARWGGAPPNLGSPGPGIGWARAQRRSGCWLRTKTPRTSRS